MFPFPSFTLYSRCRNLRAGLINYIDEIRGIEENGKRLKDKTEIEKNKDDQRKLQWLELRTPISQLGLQENP